VRSSAAGRVVSWSDLASMGPLATVGVSELPRGRVLDQKTGNQVGAVDYVYATHACYVAVDPVSGQTRVLRYVAAQDLGYVHDLEVVRGQLYGGTVMGIAQTLGEHLDAHNGSVGVSGLHDYLVPTSLDAPEAIVLEILESGTGLGPRGAKGVGEIGAVAAPLAIANALFDATGWQPTAIPVPPMELAKRFEQKEYRDG
ncbi:MAG: xanthine dehydrogenase family protein molybdopterin-binding subunit, partial [Nannocystaceae bacterium]|nr:xanthine dehydrogenase family protein molybdopterin-binding subunit [Nannocystaceae bacterium]